jgi:hypothetical protein
MTYSTRYFFCVSNSPNFNYCAFSVYALLQDLSSLVSSQTDQLSTSVNPISYVFDQLHRPNVDFDPDQESLLSWQRVPNAAKQTTVVLGKGPVGGIWGFDGEVHEDKYKAVRYATRAHL